MAGGRIVLSDGTFTISATTQAQNSGVISIARDDVALEGMGRATLLDFVTGQGLPDRYMVGILGGAYERTGVELRGFRIRGHDPQHHGIRIAGATDYLIEDVLISHDGAGGASTDEGIQHAGDIAPIRGGIIRRVLVTGFDKGIEYAAGDNGCHDCYNYNLQLYGNGTGLNFRTGGSVVPQRIHSYGLIARDNTSNGVNIDDGDWLEFIDCLLASSGGANFNTTTTGKGVHYLRLRNVYSLLAGGSGFFLNGYGHVLELCHARNNGTNTGNSNIARSNFRVAAVNCKFYRCWAGDDQPSPTATNGFREATSAYGNVYEDCETDGNHVTQEFDLQGSHVWRGVVRTPTSIGAGADQDVVAARALADGATEVWEVTAVAGDNIRGWWRATASRSGSFITGTVVEDFDTDGATVAVVDNLNGTYDLNIANNGVAAQNFTYRLLRS